MHGSEIKLDAIGLQLFLLQYQLMYKVTEYEHSFE